MNKTATQWTVRAAEAATAWLNAAIACGQGEGRPVLYRTLSVEFFPSGVQFIGTDGTMLFRAWTPLCDIGDLPAPLPNTYDSPNDSVVVMDTEKFALGFMKTLLSACGDEPHELTISIEEAARNEDEPPLGDEVAEYVLTLRALGQELTCKLFEGQYPNWRAMQFGLDPAERVDGMILATRIFAAVGKLKGVVGIECEFRGEEKAIAFRDNGPDPRVTGVLMPMRRSAERKRSEASSDEDEE